MTGVVAAPPRSRWVALAALSLAVLLIAVDATVVGLAIPFLTEDLRPSATELLWIGDVYSFVLAGLLITMGGVGDRIGRRRLLLIGAAGFGAVSVLAAFAPTAGALVAARALLGVAGATLMPSTLSIIRNLFGDARERTLAIGVWGAMGAAGMAIGPLVGGVLLEHFWWGSVFLINVPVMLLLVVVGGLTLPESRDPNPGSWDLPGATLSTLGVIGIVYAIKELAAGGAAPPIVVASVVGVLALTAFVRRQARRPAPLVDVRLFGRRRFSGAVLTDTLAMFGLSGLIFFISQFLQLVQGYGPLDAGLRELPLVAGAALGGLLAGALASRWAARPVVVLGQAAMGLALASVPLLRADTGYAVIGVALFVAGLGAGAAFTLTADIVLASVPREQAGAASGLAETAYELGTALGIALLGSVVNGGYRSGIGVPAGVPEPAVAAARDSLGAAHAVAGTLPPEVGGPLLLAAREAFVHGLAVASGFGALLLFAAAGAAWLLLRDGSREGRRRQTRG